MTDCQHDWTKTEETADYVTHKCSKCGQVYTRAKQK